MENNRKKAVTSHPGILAAVLHEITDLCLKFKNKTDMKMLSTSLHEIETAAELEKYINENENVMVCCGRMGPMCIPVYGVMEELEEEREQYEICHHGL